MLDVSDTPEKNHRQWIVIGLILGMAVITIGVLVSFRLLNREQNDGMILELPVEDGTPIQQGSTQNVFLFFVSPEGLKLVAEERTLFLPDDLEQRLHQVLQELILGSKGELLSGIPTGTVAQSVFLDSTGTAYLDFSKDLSEFHPGGTTAEHLTIESIVRTTIVNFRDQVRQVQILIDGAEVETLIARSGGGGHVDISRPLTLRVDQPSTQP